MTMNSVIVGAARTPIVKFNGGSASLQAVDLGGRVIEVALGRSGVDGGQICRVINGGAVALGHPIGATGARLIFTLFNVLQQRVGGYGVATLCGRGDQGDSLVIKVAQ